MDRPGDGLGDRARHSKGPSRGNIRSQPGWPGRRFHILDSTIVACARGFRAPRCNGDLGSFPDSLGSWGAIEFDDCSKRAKPHDLRENVEVDLESLSARAQNPRGHPSRIGDRRTVKPPCEKSHEKAKD